MQNLCALAAASAGIEDGHLAIEYVDEQRIAQLNGEYRDKEGPTDVLSFPIDGTTLQADGLTPLDGIAPHEGAVVGEDSAPLGGAAEHGATQPDGAALSGDGRVERELGDVVICPEHTIDLREAIVHGVLHLVGLDHETDNGEMLALQAELLAWEQG